LSILRLLFVLSPGAASIAAARLEHSSGTAGGVVMHAARPRRPENGEWR